MSHYIRSAIKEFPDHSANRKLQLIKAIEHFYRNNRDNLSQVYAKHNNAVKRANELALAGHITQTVSEIFFPKIINTYIFLEILTRQLLSLTKMAINTTLP